jgi:nitrite reductase/ring-hydroxylating ferredoxin subunit
MNDPAATAPQWTAVGKVAEWDDDKGRLVQVGARRIGVYRHQGRWFALKDICPHAGVALHHGPVYDGTVTCVAHGWRFELATGRCDGMGDSYKVNTYPVRVTDDGSVEVGV